VSFTTVPLASMNYITPGGQSAVLWNRTQAAALFSWLNKDNGTARPRKSLSSDHAKRTRKATLSRAKVSVDVYNGTQLGGLSATTGKQLSGLGFGVRRSGLNWSSSTVARTLIRYPASQAAGARLLARVLPGASLQEISGLPRIQLVLGSTGHTVTGGTSAPAKPAGPGQQRTAAQAACR
jgi:hypothetical protein